MAINSHDDYCARDASSRNNKRVKKSEETSETVPQQAENQETFHHYQQRIWDENQTRFDALIMKLNLSNIRETCTELLFNNILKGRGLLCRSILEETVASPNSIPVLASLVAVINSKLPDIGYLLLKRTIVQFSNAFDAGEEMILPPLSKLLAQLINHGVVHPYVAAEFLSALLHEASEVRVDVGVTFLLECGYYLQRVYPSALDDAFESFAEIKKSKKEKRSYCLITGLFEIRRDDFIGLQEPKDGLDLVDVDDQTIHKISFLDNLDPESSVDCFRFDPEFLENEAKYTVLAEGFLGEASQ